MMRKLIFNIFIILIFALIISTCQKPSPLIDPQMQILTSWMTGSFSSQKQAEANSNYYDIRLEMVQIWRDRTDGVWLYIEQAADGFQDKPYRQRIYKLRKTKDGKFESSVFKFDDPMRFVGAWKNENPLGDLTPDSLTEREGCSILLELVDSVFVGSTLGKNCSSDWGEASYVTSEVWIQENVLTTWDRGYDSTDTQVWGAERGPYIFNKIKDYK